MDKSNIAFAVITSILGIYISVALLLSRVRESRMDKTRYRRQAEAKDNKRSGSWTSFTS
jgi:hypothetical protein